MHILFVHRNFPAQFGHIAAHLVENFGYQCSYISEKPPGIEGGIQKIQYRIAGGATSHTHYCSRSFENATWHAAGVYEALKAHKPALEPDLIVGHSGFGSTLFLPELFPGVPILNYFEYYYHARNSDLDFRPEWPPLEYDLLRSRSRNAMILLDLEYSTAGYTPTCFQKSLFPEKYSEKIEIIHDGIDTDFWQRDPEPSRTLGDVTLPEGCRVVTYVARGLEAMRGFDIFMKTARILTDRFPDVHFLVVGSEEVAYGGDLKHISAPSFKAHILSQDQYDLSRFHFLGYVPPEVLRQVFSLSDLHIYLTVPFVLSWSLLDAMACECIVLASDTAPVRDAIVHQQNGLLCDFFDVEGFANSAGEVLQNLADFRRTFAAPARQTILSQYSLAEIFPRLLQFYNRHASARI
jgi:glycosyltransferase involved in cell wall biosynthesis